MDYIYNDYFPIQTALIKEKMAYIFQRLTSSQLEWIADNREYGEKERYRVKGEVDDSLKSAAIVCEERLRIEKLFAEYELEKAVALYQNLLYKRIRELNSQYEEIFNIPYDLHNLKKYWTDLERISDLDNAHAMYLSSNNWDFSVFNNVLEKLSIILNNDYSRLNSILCAGVEDVRSSLYSTFDNTWGGLTKEDFYCRIISDREYVRENGICPCFAYVTLQAPKLTNVFDREKYINSLSKIKKELNMMEREHFENIFSLYCKLYYMRLAYDTYEYFGYYSLIRHYAIFITYTWLTKESMKKADDFKHLASTYQFSRIKNVL